MQHRAFVLIRSAIFAALFVSLFIWFLPRWIAASLGIHLQMVPNVAAIALLAIGGLMMLRCVFDFAWTGRGTPAPFDPPRHLVVTGLYRWVRNPMYLGMGLFLIGEALLLPAITFHLLAMVAVCFAMVSMLILLYEEPALRRLFDGEYEEYCRHVRRWIPRARPFDKAASVP